MTKNDRVQKHVQFDEDGFFINNACWSEDIASTIALMDHEGKLTHSQFKLLRFLREFYQKFNTVPGERYVCKSNDMEGLCVTKMFHRGMREAWRLAGLPNPGEEAKSYM